MRKDRLSGWGRGQGDRLMKYQVFYVFLSLLPPHLPSSVNVSTHGLMIYTTDLEVGRCKLRSNCETDFSVTHDGQILLNAHLRVTFQSTRLESTAHTGTSKTSTEDYKRVFSPPAFANFRQSSRAGPSQTESKSVLLNSIGAVPPQPPPFLLLLLCVVQHAQIYARTRACRAKLCQLFKQRNPGLGTGSPLKQRPRSMETSGPHSALRRTHLEMATFVKGLIKTFLRQGILQVFPLLHLVTIPSVFLCFLTERG